MSSIPADLHYTPDHEYVKSTSDASVVAVGITDYAQGELGDVVYLELPKKGAKFAAHATFGTIEAEPALVNTDPYGDGWMIKLRTTDAAAVGTLLDAAAYTKQLAGK
jgi:glycine cleavage system H protein